MTPLWLWFRSEARRRGRAWAGLALLVGLTGGVVIGSVAGARRTDTAYTRFLAASNPGDLVVQAVPFPLPIDEISRLPEVEFAQNTPYVFLNPAPGERELELSAILGPDTERATYDRSKVLEGRRARADRADEVTINKVAAAAGIKVGSTLRLQAWTPEGARAYLEDGRTAPDGVIVEVKVVGVEVAPGDFLPSEQDEGNMLLTPAFARQYGHQIGLVDILRIKLRNGPADIPAFKAGVERISDGTPVQFTTLDQDTTQVQRAIHIQAVALHLFALLAGVAALLILGQALTRQATLDAENQPTLATLGLTRHQRWIGLLMPPAVVAVTGAALAAAVAIAASSLTPFGIARDAEPDPGIAVDGLVIGVGLAALVIVLLTIVAAPAWRATRTVGVASLRVARPSRLADGLARSGMPPVAVTGARMAVASGGSQPAISARAALAGTTLSVIALVTALTFGTSLRHLVGEPRLYGWNWDALVGGMFFEDMAEDVVPVLSTNRSLAGFSTVTLAEAEIGNVRVPTFGFQPHSGSVFPPLVSGRLPLQPDEIVLGTKTIGAVGRQVGDTVTMRVGDDVAEMRIVGRGVLPALSGGDIAGLGEGAFLTGEGLARFVPNAPRSIFVVRFAEGVSDGEAQESLAPLAERAGVETASPPKRVADFGRVDDMPLVLSGLLAVIAAATLVHALISAVRRSRREFAILKTLGFVRGQVRASVAWQATILTIIALGLAIPVGAAAGRWSWQLFAGDLGIVPVPVVPLVAVATTVPLAILIANAVAALPARSAALTRPALVLREH